MGDAAAQALAEALLEVSAELKASARSLDRATLQITRTANASEDTQAMVLNEIRDSKLAHERAVECFEKVPIALAVLAVAVQTAATQSTEARTEARRAADNTAPHPRVELDVDDTDKAIGKFVRGVFKKGWVKLAVASGGGLGVGGLFHWLIDHFTKGK